MLNCTVSVHLDWQLILYIDNVQLYILILYFVLFKVHWCKKYSGSRIVACNPACCSRARIWATGYISGHQGAPSRGHQGAPSGDLAWGTKLAPTNHSSKTNPVLLLQAISTHFRTEKHQHNQKLTFPQRRYYFKSKR